MTTTTKVVGGKPKRDRESKRERERVRKNDREIEWHFITMRSDRNFIFLLNDVLLLGLLTEWSERRTSISSRCIDIPSGHSKDFQLNPSHTHEKYVLVEDWIHFAYSVCVKRATSSPVSSLNFYQLIVFISVVWFNLQWNLIESSSCSKLNQPNNEIIIVRIQCTMNT